MAGAHGAIQGSYGKGGKPTVGVRPRPPQNPAGAESLPPTPSALH